MDDTTKSYGTVLQPDGVALVRDIDGERSCLAKVSTEAIAKDATSVLLWALIQETRGVRNELALLNQRAAAPVQQPDMSAVLSEMTKSFPGIGDLVANLQGAKS